MTESLQRTVREASTVYGGVLVDEQMYVIELSNPDDYGEWPDDENMAMITALLKTFNDLAEFIEDTQEKLGVDLDEVAARHLDSPRQPTKVTTRTEAQNLVSDAQSLYLTYESDSEWGTDRDADRDADEALEAILVVAYWLVDESRDRLRDLPLDVRRVVEKAAEDTEYDLPSV